MDAETIKKRERQLSNIFRDISKEKKKLVGDLIKQAAFMAENLSDLQAKIMEHGAVVTSTNGNGFEVTQESAAQKSYNTTINRYTTVIKTLTDILPDANADATKKAGEALAAFVAKGK